MTWVDGYWSTADGLRLHYRDYPGPADGGNRPPILCIPGLTRNARDFEQVAERLSDRHRLLCVDLRGRGESAYAKDSTSYVPAVYCDDVDALIAQLELDRIILFGTSLGGIVSAALAGRHPDRIAGVLVNDIGPQVDARGLERIRGIVGRAQSWPTWFHAARHFSEVNAAIYPRWSLDDWIVQAKKVCRLNAAGRIILDYDMRIAEPFRAQPAAPETDFTPLFDLLRGIPTLVVRGGLSDLLSEGTLESMVRSNPAAQGVTVPDVGHAPTLEEPEAAEAIDRFLARLEDEESS